MKTTIIHPIHPKEFKRLADRVETMPCEKLRVLVENLLRIWWIDPVSERVDTVLARPASVMPRVTDLLLEHDLGPSKDMGFPWCEACGSYHHPENPTCRRKRTGVAAATREA
jgi:hypothetical protein